MTAKDLVKGTKYKVVKLPLGMKTLDGSSRGEFVLGEIVVYAYTTYNSYDGFHMVFFEESADGKERVMMGNYGEQEEAFFDRFQECFAAV